MQSLIAMGGVDAAQAPQHGEWDGEDLAPPGCLGCGVETPYWWCEACEDAAEAAP